MNDVFHRIIVPLDGSPESEVALSAAMPLVRAQGTELNLLRVVEDREQLPQARAYLENACQALQSSYVETTFGLRVGRAAEQILNYALSAEADLIAMATHGRSGLSRVFLGSVTEEVLRHATVPILVTRPGTVAREWKRIVVSLDGSPRSEEILPDAARIARLMGATVDLVRAGTLISVGATGDMPFYSAPDEVVPYLDGLRRTLAVEGVVARPAELYGDPASEIVRHAEAAGAGLICLCTHGRTGLPRLVVGSVAEAVIRRAPCAVLVRRHLAVPVVASGGSHA